MLLALTTVPRSVPALPERVTPPRATVTRRDTTPAVSPADVQFMQGMIEHHAQALVMAALVPSHTSNPSMHLLAQRIAISQRDEIALMQRWLTDRHQHVPDPAILHAPRDSAVHAMPMPPGQHMVMAMVMAPGVMMPGMLTPAQLEQLSSAHGVAFDRLFLRDMIGHHEGALVMVSSLLATRGAGQDPAVFQFASDVEADQRAEIARMRTLLGALERRAHR